MTNEVEITSFDTRYEDYRLKNPGMERELLSSIAESGIHDPLEGVDTESGRILLNGFKRYRCAIKLSIGMAPYTSLGKDEATGIIQLIRISNSKSLSILEQARLIDDLKNIHRLSVSEIAESLSRSKAWVSVRTGIIGQMSEEVRRKIFSGAFPVYSYMYTLRQFIRINCAGKKEIDEFVTAVAGKKLSIRAIEQLAYGYFRGPDEFREQIKAGHIVWSLESMRRVPESPDACNEYERGMLKDLEIIKKYMQRVMGKIQDKRLKNNSFFAQANLLSGGILSKINIFSKILRDFYDRSGQA